MRVIKIVITEASEDSVTTDNKTDCFTKVKLLRRKHLNNLFFGHLSINSLRNKREFHEPLIRNHFDIFLVSGTKFDSSFPGSEFTIPGIDYFVETEVNMEEVWFMWTRIFLVKLLILSIFQTVIPSEFDLRNK